jgi:membrane fusion protein, multidrug efflux system
MSLRKAESKKEAMAKRMILMLVVTAAVIGGLGFFKFQQFQEAAGQAAGFQPPPEAVTTILAKQEQWPNTLAAIGTMAAVQGVTISADLPGTVERIAFDSGKSIRKGDLLVQLDTRQERAQLATIEAQREFARVNFDRMKGLLDQRVISRAEYDRALSDQKQTDAQVGEVNATIDRKTIRAPFSGVLGIRQVNLGQYLAAGNPIVQLQSLDPIYANFGVPQQDSGQIRLGRTVRVKADELTGVEFEGRITAVDPRVDEATRNVQVQATLPNPSGKLRPGMFVQAEVVIGAAQSVVTLPASAISYAPYGDSVFVVTDMKGADGSAYRGVRQQFVKLGGSRGDQVAVLSGVGANDEVVTSGVFKLRNGAAVLVNNKVQPANSRTPKPGDS